MILLLYAYIVLQLINVEKLLGNSFIIAGYPLATWVVYSLYVITILATLFYFLVQHDNRFRVLFLLFFTFAVLFLIIRSYTLYKTPTNIMNDSVRYILPVQLYAFLYVTKYNYKTLMRVIIYTIFGIAGIALLFMTGILSSLFNTSYLSGLTRSSTIIDGGTGLIALALGLYWLFFDTDVFSEPISILLILSGIIIVASGMSRARIITAILILICYLIIAAVTRKGKKSKKISLSKALFFISVAAAIIAIVASGLAGQMYEQIMARFDTIGTDNPSIYREYERAKQLEIFKMLPLFGCGWSGMRYFTVKDTYGIPRAINMHNMYTSILAMGGILLAAVYLLWFGNILIENLRSFSKDKNAKLHLVILMVIIVMSISSTGFGKPSMIVGMIIIYANMKLGAPALQEVCNE